MSIKRFFQTAALAVMAVIFMSSCGNHELFMDGKSEYVIVVDSLASPSEQYAAKELQHWLAEVSGATLPIVNLEGGEKGKRLIVGYNSLTKQLIEDAERPDDRDDAFTWRSKGGDILFWGGAKRGTLYSVYSFLEEELGCRWYSPKVSVAPKHEGWTFRKLNHSEKPGIIIRDNCVFDVRTNPVFSARLRNNFVRVPSGEGEETIPGSAEGYWGVHAMGYFMSSGEYYKSHPEYFSLRDGKRLDGYAQLCLSNPDVLRICTEKMKAKMRDEPDFLIYSLEQCDNQLYCTCPDCEALAEKYGGQSGVMIWFVNQVADAVKEEFPNKFIGTFAYQYTRHAPKNIVPRENVVVRLCSIECCMLHKYDECDENKQFLQDMKDWAAIAPHLYIWDYVTSFATYCLPVANWKTMGPHVKDFRDYHAIGILEEGDYQTVSCELREMRSWLLSKLMWNPDADVDELVKDFTEGYYGEAGQYIRDYISLEEKILRRKGMHSNCYPWVTHEMYTKEFVEKGRDLFAKAKKAVADNPDLLARVETAEYPLCYIQLERDPATAFKTQADEIFLRVVEREGIEQMNEPNSIRASEIAKSIAERKKAFEEAPLPAQKAKKGKNGFAFTRYEGEFKTTEQMVAEGKVTGEGVKKTIEIESDSANNHFGYVFDAWMKVPSDGFYKFDISSDDGVVLCIDDKEIINGDGSHSEKSYTSFVNLQKGFHRFVLRYFDDAEEQKLEVRITDATGYSHQLAENSFYQPKKKK